MFDFRTFDFPIRSAAALLTLAFVATAPAGCQGATTPTPRSTSTVAAQSDSIVRLYAAKQSVYAMAEETVVRDRAAWEAMWQQLHNGLAADPLPAVDFTRDMVVLVAVGQRSTGGTSVRVDGVAAAAGGAVVRYTVTEPGAGCMSTQVITAPVDVVRVPRAAGAVRFERRVTQSVC